MVGLPDCAPSPTSVIVNVPPVSPTLQILSCVTTGVASVASPTAKLDFGTKAEREAGAVGESAQAASENNPAPNASAAIPFMRMSSPLPRVGWTYENCCVEETSPSASH